MSKIKKVTIAEKNQSAFDGLTPTERKLSNHMLNNYPSSCLGSITAVAAAAAVSTPTVVRMTKKIGFAGFPDFQLTLHNEIEEQINNPIAKFSRWSQQSSDTHVLNLFADAIVENLNQSLDQIDPHNFDAVVDLLSKEKQRMYLVGGRISSSLADYFYAHLQMIRRNVTYLDPNPARWSSHLLDMTPGNVLVAFDVRRYEQNLITFCKAANARGVTIVLFTDQWGSPAAKYAKHVFNLRIEAPSAWDSSVATLFVIESLLSALQKKTWTTTKNRVEDLEKLFDETKLFKKNPNIKDKS